MTNNKNNNEEAAEVVVVSSNEISKQIEEAGLVPASDSAVKITNSFTQFFQDINQYKERVQALVVTDETQVDKMKEAREARLKLVKIRTGADGVRKDLKAESNRYNKAVQGVYNILEYVVKPMEEHLLKQEQYIVLKRQQEQEALRISRQKECEPYREFIPLGVDLGKMVDTEYQKLFNGAKLQFDQREELKRKEEAERVEAQKKEEARIEAERVAKERLEKQRSVRYDEIAPFVPVYIEKPGVFIDLPEEEYLIELCKIKEAAKKEEEERIEAARVKKEREELIAARREQLSPYMFYIDDFDGVLNLPNESYDIEFKKIVERAEKAKKDAEEARLKREEEARIAKAKAEEAEKKAKAEKAEKDRIAAELKRREEAESKAKAEEEARIEAELNKGDAEKVEDLVDDLNGLKTKYKFKSSKNRKMYEELSSLINELITHVKR